MYLRLLLVFEYSGLKMSGEGHQCNAVKEAAVMCSVVGCY